jgi:hypothetical protein
VKCNNPPSDKIKKWANKISKISKISKDKKVVKNERIEISKKDIWH